MGHETGAVSRPVFMLTHLYGQALPFWWDGSALVQTSDIDSLDRADAGSVRRSATQSGGTAMKKRHILHPAALPTPTGISNLDAAPLTPPDVLSQACACCGAILPSPLNRLDAISGQEHLRRAVTVTLTGNHSITFLGSGGAQADALAFGRISRHYGVTAYVTTACICGNAGDPYLACRCTPKVLVAWQRRPAFQSALAADLVVEAAHISAEQHMTHRRSRRGEPDEQLIARATEARSQPPPTDALD
jgi:hypothetical protein